MFAQRGLVYSAIIFTTIETGKWVLAHDQHAFIGFCSVVIALIIAAIFKVIEGEPDQKNNGKRRKD